MSHRNILITAIDGTTGSSIAKYILEHDIFKKKVGTITGLALNQNASHAKEVQKLGCKIVQHKHGRIKQMVELMKLERAVKGVKASRSRPSTKSCANTNSFHKGVRTLIYQIQIGEP
jgi:hypothetical protein